MPNGKADGGFLVSMQVVEEHLDLIDGADSFPMKADGCDTQWMVPWRWCCGDVAPFGCKADGYAPCVGWLNCVLVGCSECFARLGVHVGLAAPTLSHFAALVEAFAGTFGLLVGFVESVDRFPFGIGVVAAPHADMYA